MRTAKRLSSFPPYWFDSLTARLNALQAAGRDVIRMDVGSPDLPPAPFIVEAMKKSADNPNHHGYQPFGGPMTFRHAAGEYYRRRFGVELDPAAEILGLIGSKEGVFHVAQAFLDPGDVALIPDPGYPAYTGGAAYAGAEIHHLPLLAKNGFMPDLAAIPDDVVKRAKILWINYPNNPTGAVATPEFFAAAVAFARKHDLLLCHDAPYTEIAYDGFRPMSVLQVPGAKAVAVEFNSLSKSYNMGGWRIGLACGNAYAIKAIHTLKSNVDSASFLPIYDAAGAALTGDQSWLEARNATYRERRDIVVQGLRSAGLQVESPKAAIYVWPRVPDGMKSEDFSSRLLEEAGVSTTPGSVFGPSGEGYVRISLGTPTPRLREAVRRVIDWLRKHHGLLRKTAADGDCSGWRLKPRLRQRSPPSRTQPA